MAEYTIHQLPIIKQIKSSENDYEKNKGITRLNKVFWSEDKRINELTKYLFNKYITVRPIRYSTDEDKYFSTLKVLICNFVVAYKSKNSFISVNLGSSSFVSKSSKNEPVKITRTIFKNLVEWLMNEEYINLYRSDANPLISISSMMEVLEPIKEMIDSYELEYKDIFFHKDYSFIKLKSEDDKFVDYDSTEETEYRNNILKEYNYYLTKSDITLEGSTIKKPVSLTSRYIGKIGQYGRINGGEWMNCKSEKRSTIKIDNKETIEIDISNSTIRLAAHLNGIDIPLEKDVYKIDDINRDTVKDVVVILQNVNAKSEKDGLNKVTGAIFEKYIAKASGIDIMHGGDGKFAIAEKKKYLNKHQSNKEIMAANRIPYTRQEIRGIVDIVYTNLNQFAYGWLLSGRGLELQYKESQVVFKVIEKFLELDKVVLTIQDSYITKKEDSKLLEEVISSSYLELFKYSPKLSLK